MRHVAAFLLGIALLLPSIAWSDPPQGSAECRHLTTQINFFAIRKGRAQELGNELWEERLDQHLQNLVERRAERCEGYSDSDQAWEALDKLVQIAAKGAVTFFTLGAF
jgi:hypothetical protein